METIMIARSLFASDKGLPSCGTRYGKVMASRWSVIPVFIQQIEAGQPLTITEAKMTRFPMNLDRAVDPVLIVFKQCEPGYRFVQKATAATIGTLAGRARQPGCDGRLGITSVQRRVQLDAFLQVQMGFGDRCPLRVRRRGGKLRTGRKIAEPVLRPLLSFGRRLA